MPIPQSRAGVFVQLARSPLSFDKLSASFKPLGLPDLLTASLEGLSASLLERANLSLRVALSPGPMSLPISKGRACTIEIPPSCVLDVEVVVSAAPNEDDGLAVISRLEGQFSRPLLLRNVLTTLSELHAVFDDHKLARLREGLSRSGRWLSDRLSQRPGRLSTHLSTVTAVARRAPSALNVARALLELGREAVEEYTGGVALQSFSAQPVKHNDIWQLQFHFSGEVILNDFVRIPFERVRLASVILPSLHASVQELMSSAPLASGELHGWKIPYAEMGEALSAAFDSVDGAFSFTGRIPDTHVKVPTFDRGMVVARLRSESELQVKGRLVGERRDDLLRLRCDDLELKHGAANLAAVLSIELARADLHSMLFAAQDTPAAERRAMSLLIPRDEGAIPSGALQLRAQIRDGSSLDAFLLDVDIDHPIAAGSTHLRSKLSGNALRGVLEAYLDVGARQLVPSLIDLQMAGAATLDEDSQLSADAHHVELGACDGPFRAQVQWKLGRSLELEFATEMTFDARVTTHIAPFPELSIFRGELLSQTEGELDLVLGLEVKPEPEGFLIDFAGTRASVSVHTLNAHLAERSFELGAARLSVHIDNTYLFSSGIGELSMVLAWDMQSMPFMRWADQSLPLLPAEMLRMVVRAQVSPSGELRLSGDRGRLYDARFLNAILHPMDEQQKWLEIIDAPSAMALLLPLLQTFSERLARWAKEAEIVLRRARRVLKEEKIEKPGDFIPRARMARTLSRILFDDLEHESAIAEVIRGVTEANGLDRRAVQRLLDELIPEHELEFDLDRLLRWLDHILSPLVLAPPTPCKLTPLVEEQGLARSLEDLPSAAQFYALVDGPQPVEPSLESRVLRCAAFLQQEQLEYLLAHGSSRFSEKALARLRYVRSLKNRVALIADGFGGIAFAPQPLAISFFLADVIEADERQRSEQNGHFPLDGLLGPEEVAALLKTGLVKAAPSKLVQINQHLLFDFMLRRGSDFCLGVLAELGLNCARVLTGVLLALLNQEQDLVRQPVDRVQRLGDLLGLELPRRDDYMAGGRWARESYFQALMSASERVIELAKPYWARKLHLQRRRLAKSSRVQALRYERLAQDAIKAIDYADSVGESCSFSPEMQGPVDVARRAYAEAFHACARCLDAKPTAFQEDWFKHFWARNHEALVVRSIVRNVQDDVDQVRPWLARRVAVMQGAESSVALDDEQRLLETIVEVQYAYDADRRALLEDPLIRLLIDPEPGRYDFTIVTAMGVVTEGVRGRELEESFLRLEAQRGVRVMRADTGTAKTLEYNAQKIEEAIRQVDTPFGIIGYSQGCANALMAESLLLTGTPSQRALLDGLVARNFLFSAINGSAHGAGGNEKFLRAMVEGELFLKYYQAVVSRTAIRHFHNTIHAALESRLLTDLLGSVESLSFDGVSKLFRDAQFLEHVPTSHVRGVLDREVLPEALEFLSNVFDRQVRGAPHDTQVTVDSAVGHPVWIRNEAAQVLAACDMGSRPQICHHWSPLSYTTEFITTERDREQHIYDLPKDRHVFPWVEVNARFGRIRTLD